MKKYYLILFTLLFVLSSCNKEKIIPNKIEPPIPSLDIPFQSFSIENMGDTIQLESGTSIIIPENALVDSLGNPLTGESVIEFREFRDGLDIFLSGIPMDFDDMGNNTHLLTGGMFDIQAMRADNKTVFINPDAPLSISLASKQEELNHDFFAFDTDSQKWELIGEPENAVNPELEIIEKNIEKLQPKLKFPLEKEYFVMSYWGAIDVLAEKDWSYYNDENKSKAKFQKYGFKVREIYNYDYIKYKGTEQISMMYLWKNITGKKIPTWLKDAYPTKLTYLGNNIYALSAQLDDKRFTSKFEVIMPLRSLFKFSANYWINNFEEALKKVEEEQERLALEARVYRSFELYEFGIYNFDVLLKSPKVNIPAEFIISNDYTIKSPENELYELDKIFILFANNTSVVKLNKNSWNQFAFVPEYNDFRIFTILPGNKIAYYPLERFQKINVDSLQNLTEPKITFELEIDERVFETKDDIKTILGL